MALALRQFQQAGQQFSYHHLCHGRREIRLLDLLPGLPLQPIECELRVVALDDKPEYEALSYVWGDPTRLTTVSLLGVPFRITKSLESALRRLRNPTKTRTLWVDAICINQSNDTERTEQMGRMREIFSQTTECAIWFGEISDIQERYEAGDKAGGKTERNDSFTEEERHGQMTAAADLPDTRFFNDDRDDVILSKYFGRHISFTPIDKRKQTVYTQMYLPFLGVFCLMRFFAANEHLLDFPLFQDTGCGTPECSQLWDEICFGLSRLMSLPWWRRIWVIQEAILPSRARLHLGPISAPFEMLHVACLNFSKHQDACCATSFCHLGYTELQNLRHIAIRMRKLSIAKEGWIHEEKCFDSGLWRYLLLLATTEATDPRDKIYALLPLMQDSWKDLKLTVSDYSLDTWQVYARATLRMVQVDRSLTVIGVSRKRDETLNLPSWVPNWASYHHKMARDDHPKKLYNASGIFHEDPVLHNDRLLLVRSREFDIIAFAGKGFGHASDRTEVETLLEWQSQARLSRLEDHTESYVGGGSRSEAFVRTLMENYEYVPGNDSRDRHQKATSATVEQYRQLLLWAHANPSRLHQRDIPPHLQHIFHHNFYLSGFQFFVTQKGYFGSVRDGARIGDRVELLIGSCKLFVLRSVSSSAFEESVGPFDCFEVVSSCYIHGLMDGELMRGYDSNTDQRTIGLL